MSAFLSASQLSTYSMQLLYYCKPLSISPPLYVCVCNRCIPHLSIITRVNISDDVMVSDR